MSEQLALIIEQLEELSDSTFAVGSFRQSIYLYVHKDKISKNVARFAHCVYGQYIIYAHRNSLKQHSLKNKHYSYGDDSFVILTVRLCT